MRLIDILNLLSKCYKRERKNSPIVSYTNQETATKHIFVNGDCCRFIVSNVDEREDGIYLDVEEY